MLILQGVLSGYPGSETKFEGCYRPLFAHFYLFGDKLLKIDSFAPQSEMTSAKIKFACWLKIG